ncbi:OstA-like protein [Cellulophaga sp. 20_2_10]|uniref:OstA-like protein n=1 Tax=Cellulophaga sp. 20_2_10 TaxID=2942476 RepID=UPI00201AAE5E|nr:OstA-like protein [Cellulophaga sp. 20_2_10]MCL5246070.1 OstA-like protein [Cellulophaga sp. 20_2_10]
MLKFKIVIGLLLFVFGVNAQVKPTEKKQINIVHGANFTKNEVKYPGASIFSRDSERQVEFEHQGATLWCDVAVFYPKENKLIAIDNVRMQQGDSIQMDSGKLEYFGDIKLAKASKKVVLQSPDATLTTDTLYFDREKQESYYRHFGTIIDTANTIKSRIGRFFMTTNKYQLQDSVTVQNPKYHVLSEQLDYYTESEHLYMYGPSTVTGKDYIMYCERGYYDTKVETGYGIKNTRIDYSNKIIEGDSVYFNKRKQFASATNNIVVTDTVNDGVIRAHYAEVYKEKDSVFATKRAVAINVMDKDSLYMHGDTLMITGKPDNRVIRAFRNAKFFKTDISGKCDSIHFDQKTGVTQLITNPIIWNIDNQMTGDSIHLISDLKTDKLDSLKVINNAFIISLDSISQTGYNQAKGKNLFGKFTNNELNMIDLVQNVEVIYYSYNDENEFIGIDESLCGKVSMLMQENAIDVITYYINPSGTTFPEGQEPERGVKLKGFVWYGDQRIYTKEDIFDEDDNNIVLPIIRGITNPIDIDAEEQERHKNQGDPVNNPPNNKATRKKSLPKPTLVKPAPKTKLKQQK